MATFVTGASGFLGGHLAEELVARGEEVFVLVRSSVPAPHLARLPVTPVVGDLGDVGLLRRALAPVTRIFHCAACSTDWAKWETYFSANVTGTENLLEAARSAPRLERFVHVSTTDVYGYPEVPCDETHPSVDAGLPYNQTKRLGELAVWRAREAWQLPVTVVRPATIYGPRGKDFTVEIAALLRQRLMATIDGGSARGGFAYVGNVVDAMLAASVSQAALGQAYNLADGTDATWQDYLRLFALALAYPDPWIDLSTATATRLARALEGIHKLLRLPGRPLLTRHAVKLLAVDQEFPAERARREFGFAPTVSLEEGVARSAAWIRQSQRQSAS
jgi:nucleoside-diphosphate-sugar epimerase